MRQVAGASLLTDLNLNLIMQSDKMQTICRHLCYLTPTTTTTKTTTSKTTTSKTTTTAAETNTTATTTREKEEDYLNKIRSGGKKRRKQQQRSSVFEESPSDPIVNNIKLALLSTLSTQQQAITKMRPNINIRKQQFTASQLRVKRERTMLSMVTIAVIVVLLLQQLVSSAQAEDSGVDESFANSRSDNPLVSPSQLSQLSSDDNKALLSVHPTRGYGDSSDLLYNDPLNTLTTTPTTGTTTNYNPVITGSEGEQSSSAGLLPHREAALIEMNRNKNRRSSDDHDDDRADDDDIDDRDDEDQSSSNRVNDMAYDPNNPPFGESLHAAREREDVEKFFDDHLGPNEEMTPQATGVAGIGLANLSGAADMEMAATSPLSMLSSMLFGRPRPTIITASPSSSSSLSPIGASSMWSGSSYDEPYSHHSSAPDGPAAVPGQYSGPVQSSASSYYNDEMGPGPTSSASSLRDIGSGGYYSGANRSPYHHHHSISYSRYPSSGHHHHHNSDGADYNGGYNPSLAAQASESGRYPTARGKPGAPLPPHNYHNHYPQSHYNNNKYASHQSNSPIRHYGQQQSAYTSMSNDDHFSASGRAPHQTQNRYSPMPTRPQYNELNGQPQLQSLAYNQQPLARPSMSTYQQYQGRSPSRYYNNQAEYQEQSTYNNGFT